MTVYSGFAHYKWPFSTAMLNYWRVLRSIMDSRDNKHSLAEFELDPKYLGKFHHDLTATSPWESWLILGESSPLMASIQFSKLL